MKRAIYEETGLIDGMTSIDAFWQALFPHLEVYGFSGAVADYDVFRDFTLGDPQGARIEYRYFGGYVDPYLGGSVSETLNSFGLVSRRTAEPFAFRITIENVAWAQTEIVLRFEGEKNEIEVLRKAAEPLLRKCMWKYKNL